MIYRTIGENYKMESNFKFIVLQSSTFAIANQNENEKWGKEKVDRFKVKWFNNIKNELTNFPINCMLHVDSLLRVSVRLVCSLISLFFVFQCV